jgi:MFS family permease
MNMSTRNRQLMACALLLTGAVGLLLMLNYAKFSSTFENRLQQRVGITGQDAARSLDAQMALGITLSDTPAQRGVLERARQSEPAIAAMAVISPRGKIVVSSGNGSEALWESARKQMPGPGGMSVAKSGERSALSVPLTNAYGVTAGSLAIEYQLEEARGNVRSAFASLLQAAGIGLLLALALLGLMSARLMGRSGTSQTGAVSRLSLALTALLLGLQGLIAFDAYRSFQRIALQDAPTLATALARTVEPTLLRALQAGIPLDALNGTDAWLATALASGPEFASIALLDSDQREIGRASKSELTPDMLRQETRSISVDGRTVASLRIGLDPAALSERTRQLAIEFLMLLLAGALLIHEVLAALLRGGRARSTDAEDVSATGGDIGLSALRFPLFLYFLGSELPRSFLPLWARDLASRPVQADDAGGFGGWLLEATQGLPQSLQASLPLSIFLLAVALSSPFAGAYCARHGARRLLALGMCFALAGQLISMFADTLPTLALARAVSGISFGCVSLAALDFIGRQGGGRAAGMAMYLAAYVAAGIAGSGLGALLYDRAGTAAVFGFGVVCSIVALCSLLRFPIQTPTSTQAPRLAASLGLLLRTPGFQKLILLASLPLQILQQGLLFYWVPLAVLSLGERTSFTGLAMMGYFAMVLLFNKPVAKLADRSGNYGRLLAIGLALAGCAGLIGGVVSAGATEWPTASVSLGAPSIFVSVVLIGIAWALAFPSQGAMALVVSRTELPGVDPAVSIGVYRTIERFGAMITPIVTAALIALLGLGGSALVLSAMLLVCGVAQLIFSKRHSS